MFIGIDVGTSEIKAILLNDQQEVVASSGVRLALSRPAPGHCEQDPQDWWDATLQALRALQEAAPQAYLSTTAIGLSGQMHGAVLLDEEDAVIRPAILWNDTRSHLECVDLMHAEPELGEIAGTLAMPGFTAPKLLWMQRHEPEKLARVKRVLLPKDYVRLRLTGEYISELSDASGTLWLDVRKRTWSQRLLEITGLDQSMMPRLIEGTEPGGQLRPQVARDLGLQSGIPVAGGAGDNAASAVGMGCAEPGSGFVSLGTSGVTFVVTDTYRPNPKQATHAFCHALPDRWHQMAVMLSAASCLEWAVRLLGVASPSSLEAMASALKPRERATAPIFLPYLSGERTPHNDAHVRGSLHDLSHETDAASVGYAVMEGVTMGLGDGLQALRAGGCDSARLSLVGGGARSAMWAQLIASALDVEIVTHSGATAGAALGAARLACLAKGGLIEDVCVSPPVERIFQPNHAEQTQLAERLERFRSLYRQPSNRLLES